MTLRGALTKMGRLFEALFSRQSARNRDRGRESEYTGRNTRFSRGCTPRKQGRLFSLREADQDSTYTD